MKRIFTILLSMGFLGTLAWTLFFLFEQAQTKPVTYTTDKPFIATIVKKAVAAGSIVPRKEVAIKPRVSGVVEEVYVEPGEFMEKDTPIAKIKIIPDAVTLNNAEARLEAAKISSKDARRELTRRKKLRKTQVISEREYNEYLLEYQLKREDLASAESNLQLIKEGASGSDDKASNVIYSTVAGMVLEVPVKAGVSVIETNTFNDGTTIASIADMSDLVFLGRVDESEVGKIREGMNLEIRIGAIENQAFQGKLEFISPKGKEKDGAIQFEIRAAIIPEDDVFIRAGYSASADIVLDRRDDVLSIREQLLQFEGEKIYVEVETASQQFDKRYPELGLSDGINIEVLSGIDKDMQIKQPR